MDPVTGLSRRQGIALAALIPIGIVVSTIATVVAEHADARCPDRVWGCATIQPGEDVIIGLLDAEDPAGAWPIEELQSRLPDDLRGHRIRIDDRSPGCSPGQASEDVRELASDPPDEPPAVLVVAAACYRTAVPMAQLASDRGMTLVVLNRVPAIPTSPPFLLARRDLEISALPTGPQAIGVASHLHELVVEHLAAVLGDAIETMGSVAVRDGEDLLIPRTPLRDGMIERGYAPA